METLIPQSWFSPLGQITLLLICVAAMAILIKGADFLVTGVAGAAYRLNFSKAVVAATVLSLGTTSPEAAVSITAATAGNGSLALGNAVGSVVCNLALIFGLGSVIASLPATPFVLLRQGGWMLGAALMTAAFAVIAYALNPASPQIGRFIGFGFLLGLLVYLFLSVRWGKHRPKSAPFSGELTKEMVEEPRHESWNKLAALSLFGLLAVLVASRIFVASIVVLSEVHWKIPKVVVAATIVSVGTSLPELVVSLTSVYKGHGEVLVGNVIGANIMNLLFVVGASSAAAPLPLLAEESAHPRIFLWLHLPAMLLIILLFLYFSYRSASAGRFRKGIGWPLLVLYAAYLSIQLLVE